MYFGTNENDYKNVLDNEFYVIPSLCICPNVYKINTTHDAV